MSVAGAERVCRVGSEVGAGGYDRDVWCIVNRHSMFTLKAGFVKKKKNDVSNSRLDLLSVYILGSVCVLPCVSALFTEAGGHAVSETDAGAQLPLPQLHVAL